MRAVAGITPREMAFEIGVLLHKAAAQFYKEEEKK